MTETDTTRTVWIQPPLRAALDRLTDWQHVALVAYGEARSEPIQGIVAVCWTLQHRVRAQTWMGKTLIDVATMPAQYSCLHPETPGDRNYQRVLAMAQAVAAKAEDPPIEWLSCAWAARGVLGGFLKDNVSGSTHYHTATLVPRPAWARNRTPTVQIGAHVFYAGVR